jgi:hypothetical protein
MVMRVTPQRKRWMFVDAETRIWCARCGTSRRSCARPSLLHSGDDQPLRDRGSTARPVRGDELGCRDGRGATCRSRIGAASLTRRGLAASDARRPHRGDTLLRPRSLLADHRRILGGVPRALLCRRRRGAGRGGPAARRGPRRARCRLRGRISCPTRRHVVADLTGGGPPNANARRSIRKTPPAEAWRGHAVLMERTGIEPVTSWLQTRRSPN